ncbi:MAG: efflux RND transporter periplasmic adaptor subunit, partial [Rhodospirillaceae bacterium]|nr:efflux RND transporter periplasmic adaptor subunit [Rhodospirillaceae bacterium]
MKDDTAPLPADLQAELGMGEASPRKLTNRRKLLLAAGAAVIVVGAVVALLPGDGETPVSYRTVEAARGPLTVTVSATGTIEPVNTVEVGAEISGQIESVLVDYNDPVTTGQVLAKLDTDNLSARVAQSRANLAAAKARVEEARATLLEARTRLARIEDLSKRGNASKQELDTATATDARARAGLLNAEAQVQVAEANLLTDETNLAKAEIRAPIDGVVLLRQVEPGQTVAASFQTPVLFKLAENLKAMELVVDIDEADIGQVKEGQAAEFTVAAFPDRPFPATITQVRYAPKSVEGVVNYQALLMVDNAELALRPGMTATASITTVQMQDALLVPAAALRFQPPRGATGEGEDPGQVKPPGLLGLFGGPPNMGRQRPTVRTATRTGERQRIWVLQNGKPTPVSIVVGPSDGQFTSISDGDLQPGMQIIVGQQASSAP